MTRQFNSDSPLPPHLTNDVIDLLAEILVQDYQQHRINTVGSPSANKPSQTLNRSVQELDRE